MLSLKKKSKFKDLTGQRFGKLYIICRGEDLNGKVMWDCVCDCGLKNRVSTSNIVNNGVKSCKFCYRKPYKKYQDIPYEFFYRIKKNAKARNHIFNITIEDIWEVYLRQNKKCVLSGLDISMGNNRDYDNSRTASLDRIDSSKGYTKDNIQWIYKKLNKMKLDMDQKEFVELCNIVTRFGKGNLYG